MNEDNFARLLRQAAADHAASRTYHAAESESRLSFLAGARFILSIRADNAIDRAKIFKIAVEALTINDEYASSMDDLRDALEKIKDICTGGTMKET